MVTPLAPDARLAARRIAATLERCAATLRDADRIESDPLVLWKLTRDLLLALHGLRWLRYGRFDVELE